MIRLDYRLSDEWRNKAATFDWVTADETSLRYRALTGDQIFVIGDVDFSAPWGWVPLLDFAAGLVAIARRLREGAPECAFEFTESDAKLEFSARDGAASLRSNYYPGQTAVVSVDDLDEAARAYAARLLREAISLYPALGKNASLKSWYPFAG